MARHLAAPVHRTSARIPSVGRSPSASAAGSAGFTELEEAFFRAGEQAADPAAHDFRDLDEPGGGVVDLAPSASRWRLVRWFRR